MKKLIIAEIGTSVNEIQLRPPIFLEDECDVFSAFILLSKGHCHMAFVKDKAENVIGIITLEDIIQQFIRKDKITRLTLSSVDTENDVLERKTENICTKFFGRFRSSSTLEIPLVEEFQMAEKGESNFKAVLN